jgi:hypothetical protein
MSNPDADGDGFGDETQDQCPANASTPGPCPPALPSLGTTPPPDTTPPALSPSGRRARLSKRGSISFFVTSNENATGQAALSLRVPKAASTVRITKRSITLVAGKHTKMSLKLSTRNATRVRNALTKKKRLTAKITLTFEDAAGNASSDREAECKTEATVRRTETAASQSLNVRGQLRALRRLLEPIRMLRLSHGGRLLPLRSGPSASAGRQLTPAEDDEQARRARLLLSWPRSSLGAPLRPSTRY